MEMKQKPILKYLEFILLTLFADIFQPVFVGIFFYFYNAYSQPSVTAGKLPNPPNKTPFVQVNIIIIWKMTYLNYGERDEGMIDHRRYAHNWNWSLKNFQFKRD